MKLSLCCKLASHLVFITCSGILELVVVSAEGREGQWMARLLFLAQCLFCVCCLQHRFFLQCLGSDVPVTFPLSQLLLAPHQVMSQQIFVKWDTSLTNSLQRPFRGLHGESKVSTSLQMGSPSTSDVGSLSRPTTEPLPVLSTSYLCCSFVLYF